MKKLLSAALTAAFMLCALALPGLGLQKAKAAGVSERPHANLSASASSATADGSSTITITATFYVYECNSTYSGGYYTGDIPSDCDNYGGVRGEKLFTNYGHPCPYQNTITVGIGVSGDATLSKTDVCGGASGTDTFTIKSSAAGTKTLTPTTSWTYSGSTVAGSGVSVTFKPVSAPAAPAKPKATPLAAPPAAPAVPAPPQTPTLSTLTAGGGEVKTDQPISIEENKPLVFSGKTVANGKLVLYVFSDPKQFTTTADKDGNWSVSVEGLPVGNHHAEVEVNDPATSQTSARAKLMEFSVVAAKKVPATVTQKPVKSSKAGLWIGLTVVLVLAGGAAAGFLFWKRKRGVRNTTNSDQSASTPNDSSSASGSAPNGPDKPV